MSKPAIEAYGLRKAFGEVRALDGLSIAVPAGSVLGLLGPNGSGKTTTVSILATSLRPDRRIHVRVAGEAAGSAHEARLTLTRVPVHLPARRAPLARERGSELGTWGGNRPRDHREGDGPPTAPAACSPRSAWWSPRMGR